jgi:hypothetical protein
MLKMNEIDRVVLTLVESAVPESTETLAQEARELLGYGALAEETDKVLKVASLIKPLRATLAKLEMDILKPESVEQYKIEQWREAMNKGFSDHLADVERGIRRHDSWINWAYYGCKWEQVDLSKYGEPIPAHVLHKAIEIKKACPEVTFVVEHLSENPDPFLIADLNGERYYIEVWDEPKFEAGLTAL